MKYFEVIAKCGHVGKNKYYEGHFFVIGNDAKQVAKEVKCMPRVKKNHKDAILGVTEISYDKYLIGYDSFLNNPYFKCQSKYQQKLVWDLIKANVKDETELQNKRREKYKKGGSKTTQEYTDFYHGNKRLRNPYKYYKMNYYYNYNDRLSA